MERLSDDGRSRPDGTFSSDRFDQEPDDPAARHAARKRHSRRVLFGVLGMAASLLWLYQGTHWAAEMLVGRATERREAGDLAGARRDVGWAFYWEPHSTSALEERAAIGLREGERDAVAQSVRDYETLLEQHADPKGGARRRGDRWRRLSSLAHAQQQLALCTEDPDEAQLLHAKAVANCTKALDEAPEMFPLKNQRAYMRAIANLGKDDLLAALQDVDRALSELKRFAESGRLDPFDQNHHAAAFLDTRAYILFLLGRFAEAEPDAQQALALMADVRMEQRRLLTGRASAVAVRALDQQLSESEAVLRHHRALVWQALGKTADAEAEFKIARDMGFNPKRGVF